MRNLVTINVVSILVLHIVPAVSGGIADTLFNGELQKKREKHDRPPLYNETTYADMLQFLRSTGFEKYTNKKFLFKLEAELGANSVEDLVDLEAFYEDVKMPEADAVNISAAARRSGMMLFLQNVKLTKNGKRQGADIFTKHIDKILANEDVETPEDIEDELTKSQLIEMGYKKDQAVALLEASGDWQARQQLSHLLATHVEKNGEMPFFEEAIFEPIVDKLVDNGVDSIEDLAEFTEEDADDAELSREDFHKIMSDQRVVDAIAEAAAEEKAEEEAEAKQKAQKLAAIAARNNASAIRIRRPPQNASTSRVHPSRSKNSSFPKWRPSRSPRASNRTRPAPRTTQP